MLYILGVVFEHVKHPLHLFATPDLDYNSALPTHQSKAVMASSTSKIPRVAVIGGGPAGLMAAEVLSEAGVLVDVYDAMPSVGRKFLLAGKGGMNITHS